MQCNEFDGCEAHGRIALYGEWCAPPSSTTVPRITPINLNAIGYSVKRYRLRTSRTANARYPHIDS